MLSQNGRISKRCGTLLGILLGADYKAGLAMFAGGRLKTQEAQQLSPGSPRGTLIIPCWGASPVESNRDSKYLSLVSINTSVPSITNSGPSLIIDYLVDVVIH